MQVRTQDACSVSLLIDRPDNNNAGVLYANHISVYEGLRDLVVADDDLIAAALMREIIDQRATTHPKGPAAVCVFFVCATVQHDARDLRVLDAPVIFDRAKFVDGYHLPDVAHRRSGSMVGR
jgi:hypothetical protein